MAEIVDVMKQATVVPVVRTGARETAERAVELLRNAGFRIFEMTLTTPGAVEATAALAARGDAIIGTGTVMTADDAERCIDAGAAFIVSPAVRADVAQVCIRRDIPCFLGAATPTEVAAAHDLGCAGVKVFPAAQLGGPGFLGALKSVFPTLNLMPTGGIGVSEVDAYLKAGAFCVGMGGKLVNEASLIARDDDAIIGAAREVLDVVGS